MAENTHYGWSRRAVVSSGFLLALAGCTGDENSPSGGGADTPTQSGNTGGEQNTQKSNSKGDDKTTKKRQSSKEKRVKVPVGKVVQDESLAMVVRSVEKTKNLSEFQEAKSGNTYVVVRMAVKNKHSSEFANFSSFWQTRLKDESNHVYEQTFAGTGSAMSSGQLAPGEVTRGDVVFEVPESASGLSLQFDFSSFDFFSLNRVTIDLDEKADTIADLKQQLKVPIHSSGESVTKHDLQVTLHGTRTETKIGQFTEAEDGHEYVIPDISVTNNTGDPLSVSIGLQMVVKDQSGQAYTLDIGSYSGLDQKFAQGFELGSGETRRGEISYQVPTDATKLYWTFEYSLIADGDKTFWQVK